MHNILSTTGVNSNSFRYSHSRRHSGLARQHTYSTVLSYLQMYGSRPQWDQKIFEVHYAKKSTKSLCFGII